MLVDCAVVGSAHIQTNVLYPMLVPTGPKRQADLRLLTARLDLAIGFARLASYFQQTGNPKEYGEQKGFAETHYRRIVQDWDELGVESNAEFREKRRIVEECL